MRELRKGSSQIEYWEADDLAKHLKIDIQMAKRIFDDYHRENNTGRYGAVESALILDYVEQKQRDQREREARYKADIATAESIAVLKEQVKTLQKQNEILHSQINEAKEMSKSSKFFSVLAIVLSALALAFEVYKYVFLI